MLGLNSHGGYCMWLPLAEYSMKHKVSISTLRRRIKAEDIQYRLDDGKYLIYDGSETHRPSLKSEQLEPSFSSHPQTSLLNQVGLNTSQIDYLSQNTVYKSEQKPAQEKPAEAESVITAANRLLSDLKKAYTQVLQEKEEQIIGLKEEISDLRTLVKVLESENQRLTRNSGLEYSFENSLDY